jgi:uncharacterized OsmC-like protein
MTTWCGIPPGFVPFALLQGPFDPVGVESPAPIVKLSAQLSADVPGCSGRGEFAMFDVEVQPTAGVVTAPRDAHDDHVLRVRWQAEDRFDIQLRGHTLIVDQPEAVGGTDVGPTPTELFVAGLASCVGFYARRYLRRHDIDAAGLEVRTSYRMAARPARVAAVDMEIQLPASLPPERRAGLLAQAAHCTVHNTIRHTPDIAIRLAPAREGWRES